MFERLPTETLNWIIIIGVLLLIIEISIFGGGVIFSALFSGLFIYLGWKNFEQLWGKIFFWVGIVFLAFSILNMMAVRFIILSIIVLLFVHYMKSKKEATRIEPFIDHLSQQSKRTEPVITVVPLLDHQFFRHQETNHHAYSWKDINIHGAFGDRIIDLSNTVLPEETAIISIRHLLGNIEIYIPYEVEVSIHHSTIFGKANILDNNYQMMNQSIIYQTENYDTNIPRVKIVTSLISGDIEVKRI